MWVILHNRLITNAAFYDRHMHPDGLCGACLDQRESYIHVLRGCTRSRQIWLKLGLMNLILISDQVIKGNG